MNDEQIEQEIQAKGLTAPPVTPEKIEAAIASEHYFTAEEGARYAAILCSGNPALESIAPYPAPLKLLTFCVLVLKDGSTVVGQSEFDSPDGLDDELRRKTARKDATDKMWPLLY